MNNIIFEKIERVGFVFANSLLVLFCFLSQYAIAPLTLIGSLSPYEETSFFSGWVFIIISVIFLVLSSLLVYKKTVLGYCLVLLYCFLNIKSAINNLLAFNQLSFFHGFATSEIWAVLVLVCFTWSFIRVACVLVRR